MPVVLMLLLFLLACGSTEKTETNTDPTSVISDINEDLTENESCEGYEGTPIPGGTSYFVGAAEDSFWTTPMH